MPRRGLRPRDRRELPPPDFKFKSVLVSRLVSKMNYQGKRSTAEGARKFAPRPSLRRCKDARKSAASASAFTRKRPRSRIRHCVRWHVPG